MADIRKKMLKGSKNRRGPPAQMMIWDLLDGSAWSTERKDMRRYKGTLDVFLGIEHRMMEKFNKETKQGWRFAARINDENAGSEVCKHTSGGVFVAIDSDLER